MFTQLDQLIDQICLDHTKRNRIEEPFSFNILNENDTEHSSTSLNGNFIFSQLLIKTLLEMNINENDRTEFYNICEKEYAENETALTMLRNFQETYSSEQALLWYSKQTFLYQLLNKALRTQNIDVLLSMTFFISDIHRQLQKLYREQTSIGIFHVYRAQLISNRELNILRESLGQLISMNSFLSTTIDQEYAAFIVDSGSTVEALENVLLKIDADGCLVGTEIFADISEYSQFPEEREVLFMPGNIFAILNVCRENEHWVIHLVLRGQYSGPLQKLIRQLKEDIGDENNLCSLGRFLTTSCKWTAAERCFRTYLEKLPSDSFQVATCYHGLGVLSIEQGRYDEALESYEKAVKLLKQTPPFIHRSSCRIQLNIGTIYVNKKDWEQALEHYQIAYNMYKQFDREESEDIAHCLDCIGNVYMEQAKHNEALDVHRQALAMKEKFLIESHPDLAACHQNIGIVLCQLGQFDLALEHCLHALTMSEKSLVSYHPDIASAYLNIGNIYFYKGHHTQAIEFLQKALLFYSKTLSSDHPHILRVKHNIEYLKTHTTEQ